MFLMWKQLRGFVEWDEKLVFFAANDSVFVEKSKGGYFATFPGTVVALWSRMNIAIDGKLSNCETFFFFPKRILSGKVVYERQSDPSVLESSIVWTQRTLKCQLNVIAVCSMNDHYEALYAAIIIWSHSDLMKNSNVHIDRWNCLVVRCLWLVVSIW